MEDCKLNGFDFTDEVMESMESTLQQEFGVEIRLDWYEGGPITTHMPVGLDATTMDAISTRMDELINIEKSKTESRVDNREV